MDAWDTWKKAFEQWEEITAPYLEEVVKSPAVLVPAGAALTAAMKAKAVTDKALAEWWGQMGLPTKRDQERLLHAVNELESRLLDIEERLEELEGE